MEAKQIYQKLKTNTSALGGEIIQNSPTALNLGVIDEQLHNHIHQVAKICHFYILIILKIRDYLSEATTKSIVFYINIPVKLRDVLQKVMNEAARPITRASRYDHITKTLIYLHWLPIKERIQFKVLVTTFKALHNLAPTHIGELLKQHLLSRSLRSSSKCLLHKPSYNLQTAGYHLLGVAAPRIWNQLPDRIRSTDNLTTFMRELKTHLFKCAYAGHL